MTDRTGSQYSTNTNAADLKKQAAKAKALATKAATKKTKEKQDNA